MENPGSPQPLTPSCGARRAACRRLVFLGPPGCGKGTAAEWISSRLDVKHVSTGEIIRHHIAAGSELGRQAAEYLSRGDLAPDDLALQIVAEWLEQNRAQGFAFDGFPRTLVQARCFQEMLESRSLRLDAVVHLNASKAAVEERILGRLVCQKCGRNFHVKRRPPAKPGICDSCGGTLVRRQDDSEEFLSLRWKAHEAQMGGLMDFYRGLGVLREVEAGGSADAMNQAVWEALST